MTKFVLYSFLLCSILGCQTETKRQENRIEHDESTLPPPPKNYDPNNIIGFACYEAGSMSNSVESFSKLLQNKDYNSVKDRLEKESPADRFLATFLCEKLFEKNLITLSSKELSQIDRNKKSSELVVICSGCTNEDELTMKELFSPQKNYCMDELEEWFKEKTN